ncbi:MAG TPA: TIGR02281 family clan AA aspartic protease [Burkholderiaceae bacterium]
MRAPSFAPLLLISLSALLLPAAWAQNVAATGIMGQRALLVIDGAAPAILAPGDSRDGVTLISVQGDQVLVEVHGNRQSVRVGDVPVSVSATPNSASATRIVLNSGPGGHFIASGQINGASVQFLVDTGATDVSMSVQEADRIGLQYRAGQRIMLNTANGAVPGYQVHLDTVRLSGVEVYNVEAIVSATSMPFVLLGNTFLTHFQLKQENDSLTLEKRF